MASTCKVKDYLSTSKTLVLVPIMLLHVFSSGVIAAPSTIAIVAASDDTETTISSFRRRLQNSDPNTARNNIVFYSVMGTIFLICAFYNICFKRRMQQEYLRQHLYTESGATYRQDVIATDTEIENTWECDVCACKNYQVQKGCMICGTERGYKLFEKKTSEHQNAESNHNIISTESGDHYVLQPDTPTEKTGPASMPLRLSFAKRRLSGLNSRQQGARRRKDWIRVEDKETGDLVWKRNDDLFDRKILNYRKTAADGSSSSSISSGQSSPAHSIGYVSELVLTPKHPEGRMAFNVAEGALAARNANVGRSNLSRIELDSVASQSFLQKQAWFVQNTAAMEIPWEYGHMTLDIDRKSLLHNSCEQLLWATPDQLHQSLRIKFKNEPGVDAGGLEREWFTLMSHEVFEDTTGLFKQNQNNVYMLNPASADASEDHLMYFQAIGRFLGRALFQGILIEAHLALPFYKHILGIPMSFSDLQYIDDDLYRNLKWLKDHSGSVIESLALDFSVAVPQFEKPPMVVDLIPDGRNICVTDENKEQYIKERMTWAMFTSVSDQLASFLKGVFSVVPKEMLSVFDHQELELLMCGIPDINVEDWKAHTKYVNQSKSDVITWFWEVVSSFTSEQRARLLQFTTGSARVPVQGFKALTMNDGRICSFAIQTISTDDCLYPRAHTCFNRLDLPTYKTKKEVENALLLVINMEVTGFTME